jgi:hypothetical protein
MQVQNAYFLQYALQLQYCEAVSRIRSASHQSMTDTMLYLSLSLCSQTLYATIGSTLGDGITNIAVLPPKREGDYISRLSPIPVPVPSTETSLIVTYEQGNMTCINLPANILSWTASSTIDSYETFWTIKQRGSTTRLLAVSKCDTSRSWCIAKVKHGSNDIDIIEVNSDASFKQLAYIKGPAITESTDVIGAIVLETTNMSLKHQLVVAHKHDNTIRVYDTVHGRELCKPMSIGISSDTIADVFVDTSSNSIFTTSTWLPSVHCWSMYIDARNTGKYMLDIANAELVAYKKLHEEGISYDFAKLMACIQQQPPTLLESLELVRWCAEENRCTELLKTLLNPKLPPFSIKGNAILYHYLYHHYKYQQCMTCEQQCSHACVMHATVAQCIQPRGVCA